MLECFLGTKQSRGWCMRVYAVQDTTCRYVSLSMCVCVCVCVRACACVYVSVCVHVFGNAAPERGAVTSAQLPPSPLLPVFFLPQSFHPSIRPICQPPPPPQLSLWAVQTVEQAMPTWSPADLHRVVAHFLRLRFPILLALNKVCCFYELALSSTPNHGPSIVTPYARTLTHSRIHTHTHTHTHT